MKIDLTPEQAEHLLAMLAARAQDFKHVGFLDPAIETTVAIEQHVKHAIEHALQASRPLTEADRCQKCYEVHRGSCRG